MDETSTSEVSKSEPAKNGLSVRSDDTAPRSVFAALFAHWKVLLPGAGALALLAHFWRIGYAPSLSFGDLGTVLGAMLLAFVLGVLVVFALFLAPLFFINQWAESGLLRGPPVPAADRERLSDRARRARERRTVRGKRSAEEDHPAFRGGFSSGSLLSFMTAGIASIATYILILFATYFIEPAYVAEVFVTVFCVVRGHGYCNLPHDR